MLKAVQTIICFLTFFQGLSEGEYGSHFPPVLVYGLKERKFYRFLPLLGSLCVSTFSIQFSNFQKRSESKPFCRGYLLYVGIKKVSVHIMWREAVLALFFNCL